MLSALRMRDYVIVEDLSLDFGPGLTAITGETGAGKSLLVGALQLLLGARAGDKVIRSGAQVAEVEALFQPIDQDDVRALLSERGLLGEDDALVVRRQVGARGLRRTWANGRLITVAELRELTRPLIDLSSQREHGALLDVRSHLQVLDRAGGHASLLASYRQAWQAWRTLQARCQTLEAARVERARRRDYLRFCVEELDSAAITEGESNTLHDELRRLHGAEDLLRGTSALASALVDDGGVRDMLARTAGELRRLSAHDRRLQVSAEQAEEVLALAEELGQDLQRYAEDVEPDPQRQAEVSARLALLHDLQRKYDADEAGLLAHRDQLGEELAETERDEGQLAALRKQLPAATAAMQHAAAALTAAREQAIGPLEREVAQVIGALGMGRARLEVLLEPREGDPGPDGMERAEFRLAANVGEPARPLVDVASGGELSRLLLAVKRACGGDPVPVCVYDEIDAGLGGTTGLVLGRYLSELGRQQQVLCITHLPQVAAAADRQVHVAKGTEEGRTRAAARTLQGADRQREIARMLGVAGDEETALAHAEALLSGSGG